MTPLDTTLIADWPFAHLPIPGLPAPHAGSHSPTAVSSDVPASRPAVGDLKQPSAVGGRPATSSARSWGSERSDDAPVASVATVPPGH